jgi:hypothetical protein
MVSTTDPYGRTSANSNSNDKVKEDRMERACSTDRRAGYCLKDCGLLLKSTTFRRLDSVCLCRMGPTGYVPTEAECSLRKVF